MGADGAGVDAAGTPRAGAPYVAVGGPSCTDEWKLSTGTTVAAGEAVGLVGAVTVYAE